MLIAIDHGNKQVKTVHGNAIVSGVQKSRTRPYGWDVLKYSGSYYTLSAQRIPYQKDKTTDERFFILSLFAIAEEIEAQGGWAQLLYDPTDKLSFGLGYSVDDPKDEDVAEGKPSKNESIFGNVAYKVTAAVTALAEYAHMTTDYLGRDDAQNDRVQVAMKYAF